MELFYEFVLFVLRFPVYVVALICLLSTTACIYNCDSRKVLDDYMMFHSSYIGDRIVLLMIKHNYHTLFLQVTSYQERNRALGSFPK